MQNRLSEELLKQHTEFCLSVPIRSNEYVLQSINLSANPDLMFERSVPVSHINGGRRRYTLVEYAILTYNIKLLQYLYRISKKSDDCLQSFTSETANIMTTGNAYGGRYYDLSAYIDA